MVYGLLLAGSAVFLLPFIWLIVTSLKPIEQTTVMPPTWVPRMYTAQVDGKRIEVTKDFVVTQKSALVVVNDGPQKGRRLLIANKDFDAASATASMPVFENGSQRVHAYPVTLLRTVEAGAWHVTELSKTKVRQHDLAWDVVP